MAVRLFYRQTAALPLCLWFFFASDSPFLLLFLFFLFLRVLFLLCSFLAAAVTILFLLPPPSPLYLDSRFYPRSVIPHSATPPHSLAMNQTAFHACRLAGLASYVTKCRRGKGGFLFLRFLFFPLSVFCRSPLSSLCVWQCCFGRQRRRSLATVVLASVPLQSAGCEMCGSDSERRPHASPAR